MVKYTELVSKILVSTDGTEIIAECIGNLAKPHIVFVHGFTLSGSVFDKVFNDAKYQEEYYLVRYDMRGHGRSGKPESIDDHKPQLYADDFVAVSKAFSLYKPVFVGWSLGGTPAADIVACLPEDTLSGIVYVSSFFGTQYIPLFATPFAIEQVSILISASSSSESLKSANIQFSDGIFDWVEDCHPYSHSEARLRQLQRWSVQTQWLGFGIHQNTAHRYCAINRQQDTEPLFTLGKTGFPILIVHGTRDALIYADKLVDEAKKHFTNLTIALIEDRGNHALFYENTSLVMKHIGSFVSVNETQSKSFSP